MQLLPPGRAALIQSNAEIVPTLTCPIDVQTIWLLHIARRVDEAPECSVENDDCSNEIVGALGGDVLHSSQIEHSPIDGRALLLVMLLVHLAGSGGACAWIQQISARASISIEWIAHASHESVCCGHSGGAAGDA